MLRELAKRTPPVYRAGLALREARRHRRSWPHPERLSNAAKHELLRATARSYGLRVLVETGTYAGETCYWLRRDFDRIVTVELEPRLYELARSRLKPYGNIEVLWGDGAAVLSSVLDGIRGPALFWLDSHPCTTKSASGGSPVARELECVLTHPYAHVALIDDVRLLGQPGWPTLDVLRACAERHGRALDVADDIAHVCPQ